MEVPATSEVVKRRDYVLDLMKTRSFLTGDLHTASEFDAAKGEPVIIQEQVSATWRAPQFVWQVREALAQILCPDTPADCPQVDTGGYRVTTTLDWEMQKVTERYVYAEEKVTAINEVAVRDGLDLDHCWAYSDSATDIPMLAAVGHPVAVNPDRELAKAAKERGWLVEQFRLEVPLRERVSMPAPRQAAPSTFCSPEPTTSPSSPSRT